MIAQAVGGTVPMCWTIPASVTFIIAIMIFITKTIQAAVCKDWAIKVRITFCVSSKFITISIAFTISVNRAVPTGSAWVRARSRPPRTNVNQTTLDCKARKDD